MATIIVDHYGIMISIHFYGIKDLFRSFYSSTLCNRRNGLKLKIYKIGDYPAHKRPTKKQLETCMCEEGTKGEKSAHKARVTNPVFYRMMISSMFSY